MKYFSLTLDYFIFKVIFYSVKIFVEKLLDKSC